ncbi:MAG: hypothetical protein KatS3mg059_0060 [Thermomicrobiales bacterium]|nr:MAG: hypothetical protein KatS3mg059_0060 [Thermomicrobiales bacterium]
MRFWHGFAMYVWPWRLLEGEWRADAPFGPTPAPQVAALSSARCLITRNGIQHGGRMLMVFSLVCWRGQLSVVGSYLAAGALVTALNYPATGGR